MLYHLLSNRIYRGMIVHNGKAHPGKHEAIVDEQLFEQVQAKVADNAPGSSRRRMHRQLSLLTGLLFDGGGKPKTGVMPAGRTSATAIMSPGQTRLTAHLPGECPRMTSSSWCVGKWPSDW